MRSQNLDPGVDSSESIHRKTFLSTTHPTWRRLAISLAIATALTPAALRGAELGSIRGRVRHEGGAPLSGVAVVLDEGQRTPKLTDAQGLFAFESVAPGRHALTFSLGSDTTSVPIEVTAGETAEIDQTVDWQFVVAETLTVFSASRRVERIVEAPAAVSVVTGEQIARDAAVGQLPKLLESATGAEITQSGLYDFKFNLRGANLTINRRVAVLIDGRDPSFPFLGAQEWAGTGLPLDDLASAELVRGPSSALYGASAFSGILNLTTKAPRDSLGGTLRISGGELSTRRVDLRLATGLGGGWYFKGTGSYQESDDFYRSRNEELEYTEFCPGVVFLNCLLREPVPLPLDDDSVLYGGLRFDRDFGHSRLLVVEGGLGDFDGPVLAASSGRFQFVDIQRPWGRVNFNTPRWNLLGTYTGRDAEARTMSDGSPSYNDTFRSKLELQTNWDFADGRGRVVAGAAVVREEVDSTDPQGNETLITEPKETDKQAVFAQLDYDVSDRFKVVLAARWDDSTLHEPHVSPQGAMVLSITPSHTLRASYRQAFLVANYPELFVRTAVAPPLDLGFFESFCAPSGVSCGFDRPIPLLAVGNDDLEVEEIETAELGYSAVLGKTFLEVVYYRSVLSNFILNGVPQLGTALGRTNPDFGPYVPPAELPADAAAALDATLQAALGPFYYLLSNPTPDEPIFPLYSLTNFGLVDTQGVEVSLDVALARGLALELSYSWLDFDTREELVEVPLVANSPENKVHVGLTYVADRFDVGVRYRWSDSFAWRDGIVNGPVPSYQVVNLVANYRLTDSWSVGVNVSNLFDDQHYEFFSGDVVKRRALAHVAYSW